MATNKLFTGGLFVDLFERLSNFSELYGQIVINTIYLGTRYLGCNKCQIAHTAQ